MKMHEYNQRGFTLVEIMMVVIIIGILAVLAIPRYQKYLLESKLSEVQIAAGEIKQGMEKYYNSHGQRYTAIAGVAGNASLQQILRIELGAADNFLYDVSPLGTGTYAGYILTAELSATGQLEYGGSTVVGDVVVFYFPKELNSDYTDDNWVKGWNDDSFFD